MALDQLAREVGFRTALRLQLISETGEEAVAELREPFAIIGRWAECGLRLDHPSVSKRHAFLLASDDRVHFYDLGSRLGLFLNGVRCDRGCLLPGDTLQIGEVGIRLRPTPSDLIAGDRFRESTAATGEIPFVAVRTGAPPNQSKVHPLTGPVTVIGRHPHCDFQIDDERVSSFHAAVIRTPAGAWLVDLFTGTRLNGRLVRCVSLQAGDRIDLNGVTVEIQLPRPPGPPTSLAHPPHPSPAYLPAQEFVTPPPAGTFHSTEVADLRDQMRMMASMFMTVQQQQLDLMKQQAEVLREVATALRDGRLLPAATDSPAALPAPAAVPPPPLPTPRPPQPGDAEAFAQAHEWLMSRFGAVGPRPGEK